MSSSFGKRVIETGIRTAFAVAQKGVSAIQAIVPSRTLGVRGVVLDQEGRVMLVKHTYIEGWHLPGGGVENGESGPEAMCREIKEEARLLCFPSDCEPVGMFLRQAGRLSDYVMVYVVRRARSLEEAPKGVDLEISDRRWFSLEALPDDISGPTQRRISEVMGKAPRSEFW